MIQCDSILEQRSNKKNETEEEENEKEKEQKAEAPNFVHVIPSKAEEKEEEEEEEEDFQNKSSYLKMLWNEEIFSDIEFKFENETMIRAHKIVLACRCAYFDAMFRTGFAEAATKTAVRITDISRDTFLAVLYYIYVDDIQPNRTCDQLFEIMIAAGKYGLTRLTQLCSNFFISAMSLQTVFSIATFAESFHFPALLSASVDFIIKHHSNLHKKRAFKSLSSTLKQKISDDISLRENTNQNKT
eukprot:TRINITY_DN8924_c0_g1_i4.p2 TRINITY_DN8924_c0_g1~~TRINITY_DN8924_c0_g1_i4.p2  ORF type:complete len:243 (-),score=68.88 TRINITY_DN8924_c0_g1_i4:566-1294(-)